MTTPAVENGPLTAEAIERAASGAQDAVDRIQRLASLVRELGRQGREARMSMIARVDASAESEIRKVVKEAPGFIVDLVRDSVLSVADNLERVEAGQSRRDLGWMARRIEHISHDPRNAAEAAEALDAIASTVQMVPEVRKLTSATLEELEDRGILGEGVLSDVVSVLAALAYSGAIVYAATQGDEAALVVGSRRVSPGKRAGIGASISQSSLGIWTAKLQVPNPLWPAAALRFKLTGHREDAPGGGSRTVQGSTLRLDAPVPFRTRGGRVLVTPYAQSGLLGRGRQVEREAGVKATVRFGGALPATTERVEEWVLPYPKVLSRTSALVCVPGPRGLTRWLRHDPIPTDLAVEDPVRLLRCRVGVEVEAGVEHIDDLARVVLAGLSFSAEILDPGLARQALSSLTVRFLPEPVDGAFYCAMDSMIEVFQDPTSPHYAVHELAHHIDRTLGSPLLESPRCYASARRGHPLSIYTQIARRESLGPLTPIVERYVERELDWHFADAPLLRESLRSGGVPLVEALEVDGLLSEAEARTVAGMLVSTGVWTWEGELKVEAIEGALGRGLDESARAFLSGVGRLIPDNPLRHLDHVVISSRHLMAEKLNEMMSPWELFARTFHQVVRLHAVEQGAPFGLLRTSWDLPDQVIRRLRPLLLRALSESGAVDLDRVPGRVAARSAQPLESSGALAVAALAALLGLGVSEMG